MIVVLILILRSRKQIRGEENQNTARE